MVVTMHVWLILGVGGLVVIGADVSLRRLSRTSATDDARRGAERVDRDGPHTATGMREPDAVLVKCPQSFGAERQNQAPAVVVRLGVRRRPPTRIVAPRRPPNRAARRDT